jgi:hypothetical protein
MKIVLLLEILCVLLVFCLHPDLGKDIACYLHKMIFSTLATGLRVGDLGGSVLAFEVGAKERMALRATH